MHRTADDDRLFGKGSVLGRFRAIQHPEMLGGLSGRSVRVGLEEQLSELQAWAGYLANDLERAGGRIATLHAELERGETRISNLEDHTRFLEHQCSKRHVAELSGRVDRLRFELEEERAQPVRMELTAALAALEDAQSKRREQASQSESLSAELTSTRASLAAAEARADELARELREESSRREAAVASCDEQRVVAAAATARADGLSAEVAALEGLKRAVADHKARAEEEAAKGRVLSKNASEASRASEQAAAALAQAREQLATEASARERADREAAAARAALDGALRACKQSEDECARLRELLAASRQP